MTIAEAQADLRRAYTDGGPGVIVSGLVWIAASIVTARRGITVGFAVLFFGGMLIFPLALLANRVLLRRARESDENPFGMLVLESTIAMIAMLLAAWLFLRFEPSLVMPLSAIAVGTHYFAFKTAYGDRSFWLLAVLVTALGVLAIFRNVSVPGGVVATVGVVEVAFGLYLTMRRR